MIGSELVETDKHWLSFIYGGIYSEEIYNGIFVNDKNLKMLKKNLLDIFKKYE